MVIVLLGLSFFAGVGLLLWAATQSGHVLLRFCGKAVISAVLVAVLLTPALWVVAWDRWEQDWRACDAHWAGSSQESVDCMDARRASRWGPWHTLGHTADIIYEEK